MKELKYSLLYTFIFQGISWSIFTVGNESLIIPFIVSFAIIPLAIVVLYFLLSNDLINRNGLDKLKFNIILSFIWIFITGVNTSIFIKLVDNHILSICNGSGFDCFLNGIEYLLFGVILGLIVLVIAIIKLIGYIIIKIRK